MKLQIEKSRILCNDFIIHALPLVGVVTRWTPTPSKRQVHARREKMDLCGIQYMVMCKRSDISIGFV